MQAEGYEIETMLCRKDSEAEKVKASPQNEEPAATLATAKN